MWNLRKCLVDGKDVGIFHGCVDRAELVTPSMLTGGYPGGQTSDNINEARIRECMEIFRNIDKTIDGLKQRVEEALKPIVDYGRRTNNYAKTYSEC